MPLKWIRNIHALWIVVYCAIISAAFLMQILENEEPCPLCYLQRLGMLLICIAATMNLLLGVRVFHYGLMILAALFGGAVAIRQILLHICPTFSTFGIPFLGLSLYTWSFLTFVCSLFATSVLLLFHPLEEQAPLPLNKFHVGALVGLALVIVGNIFSVGVDCQLGLCPET